MSSPSMFAFESREALQGRVLRIRMSVLDLHDRDTGTSDQLTKVFLREKEFLPQPLEAVSHGLALSGS